MGIKNIQGNLNIDGNLTVQSKEVATQEWVNSVIAGKVDYLGIVNSQDELAALAVQIQSSFDDKDPMKTVVGDYCRAGTAFNLYEASAADYIGEQVHIGDILIYKGTGTAPDAGNWDIIHTEDPGSILNIVNGTGTDSIVMKYSGETDDTHFGNTSTGESAAVFGEGNNNTANRALLVGKLNTNSGVNSIQGGHGNHNENNNVIQSGWECINKGTYSIQNGWICENSGAYAIQNGYKNNNSAIYSTQNGEGNVNSGLGSAQFGQYNTNTGNNVIQCGLYNNNSTDGAIVGGVYSKNTPNALLKIGNGTGKDDEYRRNAFEVLKDGRAKVYAAPKENYDVVRKAELDKKVAVSTIDQEFFNSLYK